MAETIKDEEALQPPEDKPEEVKPKSKPKRKPPEDKPEELKPKSKPKRKPPEDKPGIETQVKTKKKTTSKNACCV